MHDKLQPLPGALFAMPDLHVVELAGRDATTFAQAQFINDLNGLQPGHWQWSGWLTPKGRTVALFAVASWSDDRIWLLLPDLDLFRELSERTEFVANLSIPTLEERAWRATPMSEGGAAWVRRRHDRHRETMR